MVNAYGISLNELLFQLPTFRFLEEKLRGRVTSYSVLRVWGAVEGSILGVRKSAHLFWPVGHRVGSTVSCGLGRGVSSAVLVPGWWGWGEGCICGVLLLFPVRHRHVDQKPG